MTLVVSPDSQARMRAIHHGPLRVGIGGPVGSGKTALVEALCKRLRDSHDIYVDAVLAKVAAQVFERRLVPAHFAEL